MSEDSNPFDAAAAATVNPQAADATAARLGYMAAQDTNPDVYAEAQRIARRTGVPTITALNVPEVKKQAMMGEIPFEAIARDAPATAALLANVETARVAHDDTANLTGVETTLRVLKGAGSSLLSSEAKFNEGAWGLLRAGSEVLGLDGIAGQAQRMGQNARARAESLVPKATNVWEAGLYSGAQSFGVNMLQLPLAFLPGGQAAAVGMAPRMAPALVSMGLNTGGQAFAEARDKGLSLPQALTFGASQGVIEAGTEMIGLPALFSALKPGQFGAKALEYLLKEQGGEQIATHLQDLNEWAVLPENKDKTFGDYLAARPNAALQTAIATAVGGGAQVATVKGVGWALNRAEYAQYQAERADAQAKALGELSQLAAANKVLQRSPETFEQFVAQATDEGPLQAVYLDGQTLHQSGLAEQVAAVSPELAAQVQQAVETGGTVAIPVPEYAARIASTPLAEQLQEHLRTEADGFSPAEAKQYMQSQGERLAAEVNAAVEQSQQGDEFRASADAVVADLRGQLDAAARFRPEVNDAYARVVGAYYATRAAALGITPQELYERRRLTVGAEGVGELNQGGVVTTDTPEFRNWFGDSKVVDADGKPLVVYHGTAADFDAFSKPKATDKDGRRLGMGWGKGKFYFASSGAAASSAASFAAATGRGTAQNVMPVYLSMKNPIAAAEFMVRVEAQMAAGKGRDQAIAAVDKAVRKEGYDGILDAETGGMAVFEPEQIKSATGNNGQFDPNDANILHQASTPTEQATAKWLTSLESMLTGRKPSAKLDTPTVPKTMGEKSQELDLPRAYLEKIASKHPDVPAEVFENLPALLSNPLLAFGHKDGGVNVVIDAKSTKGSPIVVGVRDGRITTVTPMDAADGKTSQERIADAVERTYKADGKVYARNAKALADAKASLRDTSTNPGPKSGGSATPSWASPAPFAMQRASRDRANTILREHLVKRLDPDFYQGNEGPRGMFDPERLVITLTKGADFSTFLHESGHFFFENDIALASELLLNDAVHTEGEQQLLKDVSALLSWHGIQGPVDQQIAQWHNLSFEEKRSHHERTAESFEAYLFKGEAPSVELAPYFQRFRSWLVRVYSSLKDFLSRHPEAGKLTPEVRAIFDRMLASNDAILQMEQARGMVPLFESAQQAGMSVEAWTQYQALGNQATQDAVQALQARSLRDLQWARNARSRELKRLQKEAKGLRDEQEIEARRDVMSQPIYQAWQFLTAKIEQEDAEGTEPNAGRLDATYLEAMGIPVESVNTLKARHMVAKKGMHPDFVAEKFGFTSGDELVRKLAFAPTPQELIESLADERMLEAHGELATPEAIERAADEAVHNEARGRAVATELAALVKATGETRVLTSAARQFAAAAIARLPVRQLKPGMFSNAQARAARESKAAMGRGDVATAAAQKRNELIQHYSAKEAHSALADVERGRKYLNGDFKSIPVEYREQIEALLERFDLRKAVSLKALDKRQSLAKWLDSQREAGFEPDIPEGLEDEARRQSYKDMTVEEFRGLVDAVKQIEHLGKLKHRLLLDRQQRSYEAVRDEVAGGIEQHGNGRTADNREPNTALGRWLRAVKGFGAAHIKAAAWARIMDGGQDGGPVWEHFIRPANERANQEAAMRADATAKLHAILKPVLALGKMGGAGQFFPSIGRSLNREQRIAIALNMGNEGNRQRLVDGEGWTLASIKPVLDTLTAAEWRAVQAVWEHFGSYRPQIAAKEKRVYGKEPNWVEPMPFEVTTADGQTLQMAGGYYPVKYDPAASQRAEQHADAEAAKRQLQGAYTSATTRRSFTKARSEEVKGRPLLLSLAGVYSGVNEVIHDLAWHEWLIDTHRLLRSHTIDTAIRTRYGAQVKKQLSEWAKDIAEGDSAASGQAERALGALRQGVSAAGLGFNVMSALMQPLGLTQSVVRVGPKWVAKGVAKFIASPVGTARQVNEMSEFMANRTRTRFRELNELRNMVQDQSTAKAWVGRHAYWLMLRVQQSVDVPTWWGAYEKAVADGYGDERAIALADQAVIDSQGGGELKDQAAIERGGPAAKLFTVFYSFMNTALNLGVVQGATADTPAKRAKLAADMLLLYTVPALLGSLMKDALTPGDGGDDDLEKLLRKLGAEQISYILGLFVVVREFGDAAKIVTGAEGARDYQGPAGVRVVGDTLKAVKQVGQGEFDDALRKALVNLIGDLTGLPAAQANRTITGVQALNDGKTQNPAALVFGFQERK